MADHQGTASQPTGSGTAAQEPDPRRWIALAVVLTAGFMQLVDISIVNVAIPSIQRDLDATYAQIQWVLAGYQLAFAVMLITGGRLGDIYGRKRLFMIGMAGFTLASALCGLARSPAMLVGSRVAPGPVRAAIMFPQVLSVIQVTFPPRERATAFGMFGATIGLATIAGPLVGGLLIEANLLGLEWRPIFLVNVPIGVAALLARGPLPGRVESPAGAAARPGRRRHRHRRAAVLVFPAGPGPRRGLAPVDVPVAGRRRARAGRLRRLRAAQEGARTARRWSTSTCSASARSSRGWPWPASSSWASRRSS